MRSGRRVVPRELVLVAVVALALVACVEVLNPSWTRQLGLIGVTGDLQTLTAPDSVTSLADFSITVSSFGSSSCTQPDGYDLSLAAGTATIRLYDLVAPPGTACTDDLRAFPRTLTLQFTESGSADIVVIGRGFDGAVREVNRSVTVLP